MVEGSGNAKLQQEITQMEQVLAQKRQALESQQAAGEITDLPSPKETLREVVEEQIRPASPAPAQVTQTSEDNNQPITSLPPPIEPPSYLSPQLKEQVQSLVNTAFSKSINEAIKIVRATNNAALIDAFHDVLVDELYNLLVERGKLPKI